MQKIEANFCRRQAQRLAALGNSCTDEETRREIATIAKAWVEQAHSIRLKLVTVTQSSEG